MIVRDALQIYTKHFFKNLRLSARKFIVSRISLMHESYSIDMIKTNIRMIFSFIAIRIKVLSTQSIKCILNLYRLPNK